MLMGCRCFDSARAASLSPHAATIGARRNPDHLAKQTAHVRMARKAAIESDVDERHRRVFQQFLNSFQLQGEQVTVWAVPRRSPKHTDEMDAAIAAFVRKSLETEVTIEQVHALDHSTQHVPRQPVCASVVRRKLRPIAEEEHPYCQGLCKMLRIQPFSCGAMIHIGSEEGHELPRRRVFDVRLQAQLSLWGL